ncbi:hypothetical protein BJ138DRAFT_704119 [Hygrophoropsis aurantiaca]|uniref:Uncharacterized protein n=1 Tax=Hygrophoropsis aurantiaca TaxID=72124 RepID=A0ACB7ZXS8_9AGAM|nr:hypothetical protein BJ138DRAFT_704119 [Hygrophoropsis aurantiaca]
MTRNSNTYLLGLLFTGSITSGTSVDDCGPIDKVYNVNKKKMLCAAAPRDGFMYKCSVYYFAQCQWGNGHTNPNLSV